VNSAGSGQPSTGVGKKSKRRTVIADEVLMQAFDNKQ
jgi:hypothetical protein